VRGAHDRRAFHIRVVETYSLTAQNRRIVEWARLQGSGFTSQRATGRAVASQADVAGGPSFSHSRTRPFPVFQYLSPQPRH